MSNRVKGKISFVVDGQAGSTGKGKMAGVIFDLIKPTVLVCNHGANAGHTLVDRNGKKHVFRQLPSALAMPGRGPLTVIMGAGSILDVDVLREEIRNYIRGDDVLIIDSMAVVITPEHREREAVDLKYIASTCKGVGAALADKVARKENVLLARDVAHLKQYSGMASVALRELLDEGAVVLYEGCQGYDLDINHGLSYPYCTSRGCTVSSALADLGLPPSVVGMTVMTFRPYPIRVGNIVEDGKTVGYSGEYWTDNHEISWETVAQTAGAPDDATIGELTTVTKRLRRVFTLSWDRLGMACKANDPDYLALMFADYIDWGVHDRSDISPPVTDFMLKVELRFGIPIGFVSTGPGHGATVNFVS